MRRHAATRGRVHGRARQPRSSFQNFALERPRPIADRKNPGRQSCRRTLFFRFMALLERAGRDHFFMDSVPAHHLARAPAFIGHVDGHDSRHAELRRTIQCFAVAEVIVQVGVVQVLIFGPRLVVFRQDFTVLILRDPTRRCEEQSSSIATDQVIDADAIAHCSEDIDGHAPRIFTNHLDVVGKITAVRPLPDPSHADNSTGVEQIAGAHDTRNSMNEQVRADSAGIGRIAPPFEVVMRIPISFLGMTEPSVPVEIGRLYLMLGDCGGNSPRSEFRIVTADVFDLGLNHFADDAAPNRVSGGDVTVV